MLGLLALEMRIRVREHKNTAIENNVPYFSADVTRETRVSLGVDVPRADSLPSLESGGNANVTAR